MKQEERQTTTGPIRADMTVDAIIRRYPQTAPVLLKRTMNCPACHISRFHDIRTACEKFGLDVETVISELNEAVERTGANQESV